MNIRRLGYLLGGWCALSLAGASAAGPEEPKKDGAAQEHPLLPAVRWAKEIEAKIDKEVKDYSCTIAKHERIDGKVGDVQYALLKVRHQPFSVYLRFLSPDSVKDQESIYVDGKNDGNMLAHGNGWQAKLGTLSLKPNGIIPMTNNRYPITEIGIRNLMKRLIEVGENDSQYGECEVKYFKNAKINGSEATMIQVLHPVPRKQFLFHEARIFVDDKLNVPIRYEAYDWPAKEGGKPELLEEYTYLNLKLNVGLTDADFDEKNPNYLFGK